MRARPGPTSIRQAKLGLHRGERRDGGGVEVGPRLGGAGIILEVLEIVPHSPRRERLRLLTEPRGGGG